MMDFIDIVRKRRSIREYKSDSFVRSVILTFDVEDFINDMSVRALMHVLKLLKKYDMKSLFFITGHMAEKIQKNRKILELLENHEIGYHSSAHSVRPIIPEFTDTPSYSRAVQRSLKRETSHINPFTGEPEGEGGTKIVMETFHDKDVVSFRAPGYCWTPPHLEALQKLGIRFDFSAKLFGDELSSDDVIRFKGITFYPFSTFTDTSSKNWKRYSFDIVAILQQVLKRKITCLSCHESSFVNSKLWDSIFWRSNPTNLSKVPQKGNREIVKNFMRLDMLLKGLKILEKLRIVKVAPIITEKGSKTLNTKNFDVLKTYQYSMTWAKSFFKYQPKYVLSHFLEYFDTQHPEG